MRIEIPMKMPSLNDYTKACRRNKYAGAALKKKTEKQIRPYIKDIPVIEGRVIVSFLWVENNQKRDPDNIAFAKKFILDALVAERQTQRRRKKVYYRIYGLFYKRPRSKSNNRVLYITRRGRRMSSNKKKREELERIYGKGSMFQKSRTEEYIETLPTIKGYKKYVKEKRYTSKDINKLTKRMNYHHLVHRSEGGATTIENGAVVTELEHRYIHSLPRNQEEIVNDHIREWKFDYIIMTTERVLESGELTPDYTDCIEIPVRTYHKKTKMTKKEQKAKERQREKRELQSIKKEMEER